MHKFFFIPANLLKKDINYPRLLNFCLSIDIRGVFAPSTGYENGQMSSLYNKKARRKVRRAFKIIEANKIIQPWEPLRQVLRSERPRQQVLRRRQNDVNDGYGWLF